MKPLMLLREIWLSTISRLVPALMVGFLCASMCATTMLTVGRTASAEAQILAQLQEPANREVIITDRHAAGIISASAIATLDGATNIERAVGLDAPRDMKSGVIGIGGTSIPVWSLAGDTSHAVDLVSGRWPQPGEALASQSATKILGLDSPAAYLTAGQDEFPIVGFFVARPPFDILDSGGLISLPPFSAAQNLHVIAKSPPSVAASQRLALQILGSPEPDQISVQTPSAIAEIHDQISGDFGSFGRQLLLLVLAAGALLTAVVVLADTLIRRADLGRRRALGASQTTIVLLVVLRTLLAAFCGAALGITAGFMAAFLWGVTVSWTFGLATACLTILAATLASIAPAWFAATRDPVQVLRTP